ncbi:MAG: lipopolysaccharide transport periplasmic protein LptA [Gammaproteobacteria bacterium]|nr:lipopolysaccharide transport periplasmic protein LptA [Gammaproteobacteria bacterium]
MSHNRSHLIATLFTLTTLIATGTAAAADSSNDPKKQPISIYADRLSIDDTKGVSRYQGHVELQQGDLKFSGDELELTQKDGSVTMMQAIGKPAHFERSEPKPLKAEASRIDYDNKNGEVILRGSAQLWQDGDQFSGELIHYNIDSRHVKAQGGSTDSTGDAQTGRVHVIIRPKAESEK